MEDNKFKQMKQQWIQQRSTDKYNIEWLYDYYIELRGTPININDFQQLIQIHFQSNKAVILKHIDRYYSLSVLNNLEGQFIKVVI